MKKNSILIIVEIENVFNKYIARHLVLSYFHVCCKTFGHIHATYMSTETEKKYISTI